jgi:DNA-binding IclR family transcriptional regulator
MNNVPALQRGIEIIRSAASGRYTLPQLEAELGIPKASFNRLVKCLADNEFISIKPGSRGLELGDEAIFQAMEYYENSIPYRLGYGSVYNLSNRWGVTFVIHEYCAPGRVYWRVKQVPPGGINTKPVGFCMGFFNSNAQGQLFLSQMTDREVMQYFESGKIKTDKYTITSHEEMVPRLETIRRQGYAYQERENNPFMKQIAVPLLLHGHSGKFCLTCYMPLDFEEVEKLRDNMLYEAARVSGIE